MERLQKVIAQSGVASRRKAEELMKQGRVTVDGEVITEMGYQVKQGAKIMVDGQPIVRENKVYYVMNKPKKTLCTLNDEHQRTTVVDLVDIKERVFPVGRLDYDTTGVLILTNDGEFANEIIHPRYHIPKTYELIINGILKTPEIKQLEAGIELDGVKTLPSKVWVTNKDFDKNQTSLELTIMEGRNRQVKRMMEHFGYEVRKLNRKSLGFLYVNDLRPGEYRLLKPFEVKQLRRLAKEGKMK
ncbi:MAG: rRNA pseudouridine synthase [Erysipelotrichaceae bacterium]|nr:rRNA pseudouridine synthase [Erysipelotrichaceae bacterium]